MCPRFAASCTCACGWCAQAKCGFHFRSTLTRARWLLPPALGSMATRAMWASGSVRTAHSRTRAGGAMTTAAATSAPPTFPACAGSPTSVPAGWRIAAASIARPLADRGCVQRREGCRFCCAEICAFAGASPRPSCHCLLRIAFTCRRSSRGHGPILMSLRAGRKSSLSTFAMGLWRVKTGP